MRAFRFRTRGGFGFGLDFGPTEAEFRRPDLASLPPPAFGGFMTSATWMTLIAITTFVWGGFIVVVTTAFRKEAAKGPDEEAG
jgi:hypothetical protein